MKRIIALFAFLFLVVPAYADTCTVVSGAQTWQVGAAKQIPCNTSGEVITSAGGGSGGAVDITAVGGNPVTTTVPVSGTVAVTGVATSANQTNASQKTQIVDGSGNVISSTSNKLDVQCGNCSGSGVSATDESTFTAGTDLFAPGGGFYQTTATDNALTNGQQGAWQLTANRAGFVNLRNASGTEIGTSGAPVRTDPTGSTTQPVSGTVTVTDGAGALNVIVDSGTVTTITNPVTVTDGSGSLNVIVDSGTITAVTAISNALPAGNNNIGDVDVASIAAGNNNIGDVDVASIAAGTNTIGQVGIVPVTSGGVSLFTLTAANSTNATNVKASAGQVYGLSGYSISATAAWVSLYNNAGTPTCGTGIIQQYLIPPSSGFNISFTNGKAFGTGIGICVTTGIAGTGSVAASSYVINVDYK